MDLGFEHMFYSYLCHKKATFPRFTITAPRWKRASMLHAPLALICPGVLSQLQAEGHFEPSVCRNVELRASPQFQCTRFGRMHNRSARDRTGTLAFTERL